MLPSSEATSSKVTLDSFAQTDATVPHIRPRRHRKSYHLGGQAVGAVIALCIPYIAAASPVDTSGAVDSSSSDPSNPIGSTITGWLVSAGSAVAENTGHAIITTASPDINGLYHLPDGYVILRQTFQPGFIVLSYCVAVVGSLCTLELLIRRTTNNGWRNQLLLGAAGFCFGGVSTFSMHFIFNNALGLNSGVGEYGNNMIFLMYSPGYTVLSLVASVLAMTIAFFIMGTSFQDWSCISGSRRRKHRYSGSREGRNGADEYDHWKNRHKLAATAAAAEVNGNTNTSTTSISARGFGLAAVLAKTAGIAKWSLVNPTSNQNENDTSKTVMDKWSSTNEATIGGGGGGVESDGEDEVIKNDKRLSDLDFRLGRNAARNEIERRNEVSQTMSFHSGNTTTSLGLQNESSTRLMPSPTPFLTSPLPTYYPSGRRGSMPVEVSTNELFTPGFSFPARINTFMTKPIESGPNSAPPIDRPTDELPLAYFPDLSRRRASLPNAVQREPAPSPVPPGYSRTLARIQSLSEAEQQEEHHRLSTIPSSPLNDQDDKFGAGAALSPAMHKVYEEDVHFDRDDSPTRKNPKKPARTTRTLNALERFLGFDVVTKSELIKICLTGTIAGFGVAAMHYIGQASINDIPYVAYRPEYVVGSVIIASGAVMVALYIMFIMLRPKLKHNFFSKFIVALILAVAVCCMHFCGMMGTIYGWPIDIPISNHDMLSGPNRAITAIVASLAFLACVACFVFFCVEAYQKRVERKRRRRVVVAAVMLDSNDRILVNSNDGLLPMCDIASLTSGDDKHHRRTESDTFNSAGSTILGMDLTPGHEAFVSALKMSWYWKNPQWSPLNILNAETSKEGILPSVPSVSGTIAEIRRGSFGTMASSTTNSRPARISAARFLERFVFASSSLATKLTGEHDGISRLGVLYDQILTTGYVKLAESGDTVTKGQLIFLVRRVTSSEERLDLINRNFIWADSEAVAMTLQKTLSVPLEHLTPLLEDVRLFCDSTLRMSLKPGALYAGIAVVQATPFDGLRILLDHENRSQLPMREICNLNTPPFHPDELYGTVEEMGEAITWVEGMNLLAIISRNMNTSTSDSVGGRRVSQLLKALERAIVPMLDSMLNAEDMAHILPRLQLHPVLVPLTPGSHKPPCPANAGYNPPYLLIFYANYDAAVNTFTDKWLPFSLFRAQNASVMAPKIAMAAKTEAYFATATTISNMSWTPEGDIMGRRPSKVQFEFPPGSAHSVTGTATPTGIPSPIGDGNMSNTLAPPTSGAPPMGSSLFSTYSFPPRSTDNTQSYDTPGGISTTPTSTTQLITPPTNPPIGGNGNGNGSLNGRSRTPGLGASPGPSAAAGAPRRSSLAKGSKYATDLNSGWTEVDLNPLQKCQGVAAWEADWLINLLRTKLRAADT